MIKVIFAITLTANISIITLSLISFLSKKYQFWPPPKTDSWQYRVFWTLFRIMFVGLVSLSALDFNSFLLNYIWIQYYVGLPLLVSGFGAAFYATYYLGWKNAHGDIDGLITTGWYSWSRNPIYVVSFIGMVGWGLLVNSLLVTILLILWAVIYLIAPFLEEPWLDLKYGSVYSEYKSQVPRFIGFFS